MSTYTLICKTFRNTKLRIVSLLFFGLASLAAVSQTTYTWNVSSGAWTTAGSWSPARSAPASNDILVFNGSVTAAPVVTGVPSQVIGKMQLINNVNVSFTSGSATTGTGQISSSGGTTISGSGTAFTTELATGDVVYGDVDLTAYEVSVVNSSTQLTTGGSVFSFSAQTFKIWPRITMSGGSAALSIAAGSTLNINIANSSYPVVLYVAAGSTGSVSGTLSFGSGAARLNAADAASVVFNSGSVMQTTTGFTGSAFTGVGNANVISFASGSTYIHNAGSNPFGLATPLSKVTFNSGSLYRQQSTAISVSGRTVSNFEINIGASNITLLFGSAFTVDNFTLTTATAVNYNSSGVGTLVIKGNVAVNSGTLNIGTSGTGLQTISFEGTSAQSIGGSGGTINFGPKSQLQVNNASNVNFARNITMAGTLALVKGNIVPGSFSFTYSAGSFLKYAGTSMQTSTNVEFPSTGGPDSLIIANATSPVVSSSWVTLHAPRTVKGLVVSGFMDLNTNTLTLGTSTSDIGRMVYTSGALINGTLTRWAGTAQTIPGDTVGWFPVGVNASGNINGRPLLITGAPSAGGTVSVSHVPAGNTQAGVITPFTENSITVNTRNSDGWVVSTGNGYTATGMMLRFWGTFIYGINNYATLVPTLASGVPPGSYVATTGTNNSPVLARNGLTSANLNNTFYVGGNASQNPLPVRLVELRADLSGRDAVITWTTARESGTSHFEVESSSDGRSFETLTSVDAAGTSSSLRSYSVLHTNAFAGSLTRYYRLRMVDGDGSTEYSKTISLTVQAARETFTIGAAWPNPTATGMVALEVNANAAESCTLSVLDINGREVYRAEAGLTPGINSLTVDLSTAQPGIYFARITAGDAVEHVKLIRE